MAHYKCDKTCQSNSFRHHTHCLTLCSKLNSGTALKPSNAHEITSCPHHDHAKCNNTNRKKANAPIMCPMARSSNPSHLVCWWPSSEFAAHQVAQEAETHTFTSTLKGGVRGKFFFAAMFLPFVVSVASLASTHQRDSRGRWQNTPYS